MVIKINYTSSDIYVSTNVSPIYVVVNYSGVSTGGGVWGQITGTLSNQTDLQNALNAKFDDPTGTTAQYLRGDGSLATFPTITSGTVTSVGLTMPSAFAVANSPVTSSGTIAVTGAGTSAQYVRGDGQLANFPTNGGGGSSVNYYLNGSVSQGTFGGDTYYEMSKTPIIGAGTNFTRTNAQGNGYIASFITDAGDPALLNIPGGNWNIEFYFQASSGGGSPSFYNELYKVSASNVFTLIASGSTNPEGITQGTVIDQYFTSIPVPQTSLLATDRIAIRIFVTPSGRTITLHTENSNLCEVLTTFSTGLNALNGLAAQVQYFATGTSGTDFAISSATDTHTFNLPIASGTNTGKLSNTDWTTFNNKVGGTGATGQVAYWNGTTSQTGSSTLTYSPTTSLLVNNSVTAASAIARGTNLSPTLVASANSDVLVGLDVNPTFTNGAFTGVANIAVRVNGFLQSSNFRTTISGNPNQSTTVIIGSGVGNNITQENNICIGGVNNGIGRTTAQSLTAGANNTIVGQGSASYITTGNQNSVLGSRALGGNSTTMSNNIALGDEALRFNTGSNNVSVGATSALNVTSGSGNVFLGDNAARYQANGSTNLALTGSNNIYIGQQVRGFNNTDTNAIVIGSVGIGLGSNTTVIGNSSTTDTAIYGRMLVNYSSPVLGTYAIDVNGTARVSGDALINGVTIGEGSGSVASNTALGASALLANTTGFNNTAVGNISQRFNTTASNNTSVGSQSLYSNTTGSNNIAIGLSALYNNGGGAENVAVGLQALFSNVSGVTNTAIGSGALYTNTTSYNTSIGFQSSYLTSTGGNNTALGYQAMYTNANGSQNVSIGLQSNFSNTSGSANTSIGHKSGYGTGTNANTTGGNNIFIGDGCVGESATESNRTWIGNTSTQSTWVGGNLLVGIRTNSTYKLDVNGTARVAVDLYLTRTGTSPAIILEQAQLRLVDQSTGNNTALNIYSGGLSFGGSVTATSFIKSGGTSSQYLMADGSVTTGGGGSVDELQVALLSQVYG